MTDVSSVVVGARFCFHSIYLYYC